MRVCHGCVSRALRPLIQARPRRPWHTPTQTHTHATAFQCIQNPRQPHIADAPPRYNPPHGPPRGQPLPPPRPPLRRPSPPPLHRPRPRPLRALRPLPLRHRPLPPPRRQVPRHDRTRPLRHQPVPHRPLHVPRPRQLRRRPHRHRLPLHVARRVPPQIPRALGLVDAPAQRHRRLRQLPHLPRLRLPRLLARPRHLPPAPLLHPRTHPLL